MFLDRYTIDPDAEIDEEEMQRLLKHGGKSYAGVHTSHLTFY